MAHILTLCTTIDRIDETDTYTAYDVCVDFVVYDYTVRHGEAPEFTFRFEGARFHDGCEPDESPELHSHEIAWLRTWFDQQYEAAAELASDRYAEVL